MIGTILPDLDQLQSFVEAASTLNFREAARRLHRSPGALTGHIQALEDALGDALFERSTRRVALTPAGRRLLPLAVQCLETARAAVRAVRVGSDEVELHLGTRFELGLSWLVPNLDRLKRNSSNRTLHLIFGDSPELLERARAGTLDAVVTSFRNPWSDLVGVPLHSERYAFVGAPRALPPGGVRGPLDVVGLTLLDTLEDLPLFRYLLDARGEPPWPFRRVEQLGTIGAVRLRALAGAGLAVLPRYFIEGDLESGALVELLPDAPMVPDHFRLIWRTGHPRAPELLALARELSEIPLS